MIGAVGRDSSGEALLEKYWKKVNVNVSGIRRMEEGVTGQAYITVDESGENSIILIAGTNGLVTTELIDDHMDVL